jgi:hypothetical protein
MISVFSFLGEFLHIGDKKRSGGANDTKDLWGGGGGGGGGAARI